ncbi:AAA domain-containing protein [Stutzerimonas frequens]|uniref:AAA domain-containing protein n=1 Tax=Stutzerimonas frequens TaxID=2968969 RepID=UPI00374A40F6
MNDYAFKLANYWRNSLADAENGNGALSLSQAEKLLAVPAESLAMGCLPDSLVTQLFANEPDDTPLVEITLRPWVYRARREHGRARSGLPAIITPVIGQVALSRDGRLHPNGQPLMPRDILEPIDRDSFVIGAQADLDAFLSGQDINRFEPPAEFETLEEDRHRQQWRDYLQACEKMVDEVADGWDGMEDGFERAEHALAFKEEKAEGFSRNIVALYDHLRDTQPQVPLFERFAGHTRSPDEPCLPANSLFAERLAHAGDEYALAPAQRDSLSHLLAGRSGDILAVNGPPGTGKTTLLLSVVASLWARAAVAGGEPPVIVASSTNNQAVTNIIDAFGKDFSTGSGPFAGRWLPDIKSFGAYFPKASAEAEMSRTYQTKSFFSGIESQAYLDGAQQSYLAYAAAAFADMPAPSVADTVERLRDAIGHRQRQLADIEQAWGRLVDARHVIQALLGDEPQAAIAHLDARQRSCAEQLADAQALLTRFKHYLAHEPLLYTLFGWFGPVAGKRLRLAKLQFDESATELQAASSVAEIEARLTAAVAEASKAQSTAEAQLQQAQDALQNEQRQLATWQGAIAVLPHAGTRPAADISLADCDTWADTSLRFEIFLLTTHYWEGRWLLEVAETLPEIEKSRNKTGRKTLEINWRRWMKLTPCVVATFFMLPRALHCKRHDGNGFVDAYALDFIDLLIVDEAGQVLPEVAAPSFALARQALVIGDTQQIEPIWSIPAAVDVGNLMGAGLLARDNVDDDYAAFCERGQSAANGSAMAVAQAASRYHYDPDLARGLYLYEHRRCYDSIIEYCNALCYKGKLLPRRGPKPAGGLPGLGYLHVNGICQPSHGGSRHNLLEAQTIAAWLKANEAALVERYGKALGEIVGVITPFGAQTQAIVQACAALGINAGKGDGQMTVGTVHSFQGAERPVVIFSAVYTKHADGQFIDRKDSMLNVAVSRAKDSFLVFGDMDLFSQQPIGKPRGRLAQFLFADPASELVFELQPRQDLQTSRTGLSHLHDVQEHDAFLKQTLETARYQVQIVTPWVRTRAMQHSGALESLQAAVQRGVQVTVFTDLGFNTGIGRTQLKGNPQRIAEFNEAIATLKARRVEVSIVNKVHSKLVMADDELLSVGSFNWLSAQRQGDYVHHETSMVYRGADVAGELAINRASLVQRVVRGAIAQPPLGQIDDPQPAIGCSTR